jgi:hypothetical protein
VDDQNILKRRRVSPLAVVAVAGLAGLVLGLGGVSSAATGTETPAPSTSAGAAEDGGDGDRRDCPEEKAGDAAGSDTGSAAASPTDPAV